jgi:hypothetical protein
MTPEGWVIAIALLVALSLLGLMVFLRRVSLASTCDCILGGGDGKVALCPEHWLPPSPMPPFAPKPCPFCGMSADVVTDAGRYVICSNARCCLVSPNASTREIAIALWNSIEVR